MTTTLPAPPSYAKSKAKMKAGRYLITLPGATKPTSMQRTSNVAKILDDRTAIESYRMRNVAVGMAARPDLVAMAAAHPDDRDELNSVCGQAEEAAKASAKANYGTALHAFTHQHHQGLEVPRGKWDYDFQAYVDAMERFGITTDVSMIERTVVHHKLKIAGTADRLRMHVPCLYDGAGAWVCGDVKTGRVDFGALAFAIQLGTYVNADSVYDWTTDTHEPMPEIDKSIGVIIHLPAGEARCDLYTIDLSGWSTLVKLAESVRLTRNKAKKFLNIIDVPNVEAVSAVESPKGGDALCPNTDEVTTAASSAENQEPEAPPSSPELMPTADEVTRPTSKRDELRKRIVYLIEHHKDARIEWPEGVPTFKASEDQTPEQLVEVESAINRAEKAVGASFVVLPYSEPVEPVSTPLTRDAVAALAPAAEVSAPTGPEGWPLREGADCGAARVGEIKASLERLRAQPDQLAVVVTFQKEAHDAKQGFSLQACRSERRAAIIEALVELAEATRGDMIVARAAVRHLGMLDTGAEVGTLTTDEAVRLRLIAERLGLFGVEFNEDGTKAMLVTFPPETY